MKKILALFFSLIFSFSLVSCKNEKVNETKKIVDLVGREVEIPNEINRVVCIGAGALRLYSYIGDLDKLCGVEDVDKDNTGVGKMLSIRPYKLANNEIFNKLPSCGVGGPQAQSPEAEKILSCNPDIVFSLMKDVKTIDTLQSQIKKPVVVFDYGKTEAFDETLYKSIDLMGKVLNKEERSNEVLTYIKNIETNLNDMTKNISDSEKPSMYIACQANWGSKGFESSTANYSIFDVSNIKNVLDKDFTGYQKEVDLEYLLKVNVPDKIVIDASGLGIFKNQYADKEKAKLYNSLKAFKNEEVYLQLPYNSYYTNLEIAYVDAYFNASISYPELFKDIDINEKAKEIFEFFLGKDCFDATIKALGYNFGKINLKETFPNYAK